jgi:hypothetical protein
LPNGRKGGINRRENKNTGIRGSSLSSSKTDSAHHCLIEEKIMPVTTCPACAAQISDQAATCTNCGKPLQPSPSADAPIHHTGGKILAIGTVLVAGAIIATVMGAWWGPALLFPGAAVFILGQFWS